MTFFKKLMQLLAAGGASALLILIPQLIEMFQGPAPSDISPVIWGIVGMVAVFLLNLLIAKIPRPAA